MALHFDSPGDWSGGVRRDKWEYRLVYAATFLAMFFKTAVSRPFMPQASAAVDQAGHTSIFHEARARTERIVPFVFMG